MGASDRESQYDALKNAAESDAYWHSLGLEVVSVSHGSSRLRLRFTPALRQPPNGPAQRGVLASLTEAASRLAVESLGIPELKSLATVKLNMSEVAPAFGGVVAEAHAVQLSAQMARADVELRDESDRPVAVGSAICVAVDDAGEI